jgi:hypothetical protein
MTVGEIFRDIEQFEDRLQQYYAEVRDKTREDDLRLLTYYLATRRRHTKKAFTSVSEATGARVKDTRLEDGPGFEAEHGRAILGLSPESVGAVELLNMAVDHCREQIGLYGTLTELWPDGDEARDILVRLKELEEADIKIMRDMIKMDYFQS